jgi:glycerate 2-kinase
MVNLTQLRIAAREIFEEALRTVDAGKAVHQAIRVEGSRIAIRNITVDIGKVYSIAIGKAAPKMAAALDDALGERFISGIITSNAATLSQIKLSSRWQQFHGGHPQPNEQSLAAAAASFDLLDRANDERALLIFLVSGGGSAMIEWPISQEISLADLRTANKVLVNCGASISEINSVRRAFSAVKGGRLFERAPKSDQITLIVSDVPEGEERNVASGPTVAPPPDTPDPRQVIARYDLHSKLPVTIIQAIETPQPVNLTTSAMREHFVLLSNADALKAAADAARQRGFITEIAADISDQPIERGCDLLIKRLEALRATHRNKPPDRLEAGLVQPVGASADSKHDGGVVCVISGGEFSCPVRGDGIGGRNLETALRLARSPNFSSSETVALCAGTDGIDGNSPAAGAIVDSTTMDRANKIGLDAEDFLQRSDSYTYFVALGDVVATGATGTNVRDIRILVAEADR